MRIRSERRSLLYGPLPDRERCVELLTSLRGADLLRVKGLVNVEDEAGPVVIQGVQHLFHPPVTLAEWPSAERRSRLVFITRGIQRETIEMIEPDVALLLCGVVAVGAIFAEDFPRGVGSGGRGG